MAEGAQGAKRKESEGSREIITWGGQLRCRDGAVQFALVLAARQRALAALLNSRKQFRLKLRAD